MRIAFFKSIRVLVKRELGNPEFNKFPAYGSASFISSDQSNNSKLDSFLETNNEQ